MERVFTKEVHRGQVEAPATLGAPPGLEHGGFSTQVVHFFAFGVRFGTVALDQFSILQVVSRGSLPCRH